MDLYLHKFDALAASGAEVVVADGAALTELTGHHERRLGTT